MLVISNINLLKIMPSLIPVNYYCLNSHSQALLLPDPKWSVSLKHMYTWTALNVLTKSLSLSLIHTHTYACMHTCVHTHILNKEEKVMSGKTAEELKEKGEEWKWFKYNTHV